MPAEGTVGMPAQGPQHPLCSHRHVLRGLCCEELVAQHCVPSSRTADHVSCLHVWAKPGYFQLLPRVEAVRRGGPYCEAVPCTVGHDTFRQAR